MKKPRAQISLVNSTQLNSAQLSSTQLNSAQLSSTQMIIHPAPATMPLPRASSAPSLRARARARVRTGSGSGPGSEELIDRQKRVVSEQVEENEQSQSCRALELSVSMSCHVMSISISLATHSIPFHSTFRIYHDLEMHKKPHPSSHTMASSHKGMYTPSYRFLTSLAHPSIPSPDSLPPAPHPNPRHPNRILNHSCPAIPPAFALFSGMSSNIGVKKSATRFASSLLKMVFLLQNIRECPVTEPVNVAEFAFSVEDFLGPFT